MELWAATRFLNDASLRCLKVKSPGVTDSDRPTSMKGLGDLPKDLKPSIGVTQQLRHPAGQWGDFRGAWDGGDRARLSLKQGP